MQFPPLTSLSPSFTSYSSNNLADIAARVVQEYRNEHAHEDDDDDIYNFEDDVTDAYDPENDCTEALNESDNELDVDEDESEFEFDVVCKQYNSDSDSDSSPVSNEIFFNGEILPRYPLFDRSLLLNDADKPDADSKPERVRRPLRTLFTMERESASCSSSEADDLDGVAPETYCIWKPKDEESIDSCKKSNSTGNTSKRWKLLNLLLRSNSENSVSSGKNESVIVFRNLAVTKKKRSEKVKKVEKTAKVAGEPAVVTEVTNSVSKMNKPDLAGVFANVNGLSRKLHPF